MLTVLAGCASEPVINVTRFGIVPGDRSGMTTALNADSRSFALEQFPVTPPGDLVNDITHEMEVRGWSKAPLDSAHYRLTVTYATRPINVNVLGECGRGVDLCEVDKESEANRETVGGGHRYVHTLTIRLLDMRKGAWTYKVVCDAYNDDPDQTRVLAHLVKSAVGSF
jgi:hypothetical protein